MKLIKKFYTWLAVALTAVMALGVTSCNNDMPEESYYTFTGEMMSDYLKARPQFSEFTQIVNRSQYSQRGVNLMDLISCYGQYTCFAPTNEAVEIYLKENGYSSVDQIPADICDTIARTHLVSGRIYNTSDLQGTSSLSSVNMNDRYIQVVEGYAYTQDTTQVYTIDSLEIVGKDDVHGTFRLNRSGFINYEACNDSVENGIVHTVNRVLSSSNATVVDLLNENTNVSVFTDAMEATGISEYIKGRIKDASWNPDAWEDKSIYSGGQWDYCHIPENKNYGYTVFVCPDAVLAEKYNITDLQSFYDYARGIYGGDALDMTNAADRSLLRDKSNPLHRLIAYNILNTKGMYDALTTICTIETTLVNPTEWYATLDSLTTVKLERLTVSRYIGKGPNDKRNDLYINRGDMNRGDFNHPGVHVDREVDGGYVNEGLNGVYYTTDGLADYSEDTKENIFNTRMRIDLYYIFPELMTNSIRDGRTNNYIAQSNNPDKNVTSPNYWFPKGYLDNVKVNDDGIFLFQSQHNTYWSYEGDEFNLASNSGSYDLTFNLPSVPTGTYQIRLGFCAMSTRGICQFYLDGEPQGIPFDMRNTNMVARTGWFALTSSSYDTDELEAAKKNMHNLGWYHGPRSVFNFGTEGTKDGSNASKSYFCNNGGGGYTVRYVLCTATLDENKQHTVRIKSVWAPTGAVGMYDYIEIVPKSVYGVEGTGKAEDDY